MFIRKKKNRSGTISVIVATKAQGKFKEVKTIGVSKDVSQIENFVKKARKWIDTQCGIQDVFQQVAQEQEEKRYIPNEYVSVR